MMVMDFVRRLWQWMKTFSIFSTHSHDEYERESGRIATRIYIASLMGFLTMFILYTGFTSITQTINVSITNADQYQILAARQSNLACTCQNIELTQGDFIHLQPIYHQVCSSDFVSMKWTMFLRELPNGYGSHPQDWRYMSLAQFELLAALCRLAKRTVDNALDTFNQNKILVTQLNKEADFILQSQLLVNLFTVNTKNSFERSIDLSNVLKQGDLLVSGLGTNYRFYLDNDNLDFRGVPSIVAFASNDININDVHCSCYMTSKCVMNVYTPNMYWNDSILIPGWLSGCYVQDALFSSTLECYFNISCIIHIRQAFNAPLNIQPMISRNNSRFTPKTSIDVIVRQLFVDQWSVSYNFSAYYHACAPKACSYVIDERRAFVTILGTLVGIWGGLTKALELLVPRAVRFARGPGERYRRWLMARWGPSRVRPMN